MDTMQVMYLNSNPHAPSVVREVAPIPKPGPYELLIRVHAMGVTPTELRLRQRPCLYRDPCSTAIHGHEFSGVIVDTGRKVDPRQIGLEVYGMNNCSVVGAISEYCLTAPESIARKPVRLSHVEAASVPIEALTAWQGLFERLKLAPGERLLVHAAASGVGAFAVQFAHLAGAEVVATAMAADFAYLSWLGVGELFDDGLEPFEKLVGKVDAVFDTAGGKVLERSWQVLAPGGRLVTMAEQRVGGWWRRAAKVRRSTRLDTAQLAEIARLFDKKLLQCHANTVLPLARALEAYSPVAAPPRGRRKVIISIKE